ASSGSSAAGASMSVLSGTSAAGWASHVGYQNERTSRRAWYRDPAPPSNPSKDGGLRNNVFFIADRPPGSRLAGRRGAGHPSDSGTIERGPNTRAQERRELGGGRWRRRRRARGRVGIRLREARPDPGDDPEPRRFRHRARVVETERRVVGHDPRSP